MNPKAEHALLMDVPVFTLQKELHFIPKCAAKESTTAFSVMTMLNLRWCRQGQ
jgi:hypothetical protein